MAKLADRMSIVKGSPIRALAKYMQDPELISLAGGNPNPKSFPVDDIIESATKVLKNDYAKILQYGQTEGYPPFKEACIEHLIKPRGVECSTDELLTLTGSVQGFDLISKAFIDKGDIILTEGYTFTGALQAFVLMQGELVGVEMDDEGVILADLEEKMKTLKPKLFYTIPTFQNPTGKTLSAERRKAIAELASKYDVMVLEDDPYCDLRYKGSAVPPIKTFDKDGHVLMMNSFSKILCPGLRLGVIVGPADIIEKLGVIKQSAVGFPNGLAEAIANDILRAGKLPGQIQKIVPMYKEQAEAMYAAFEKYFPEGSKCIFPEGGMFLWIELPEDVEWDIPTLSFKALSELKVAFIYGAEFSVIPGNGTNCIRLNFSMSTPEQIEKGMKILGDLFKSAM